MEHVKQLAKCDLFASMTETEIDMILKTSGIKEAKFEKGDLLAMQDESCNRLIVLTSGSVKGEMYDPSGRVVKIEDIQAPSPLAILFLFGPNNKFPVQITAREDVHCIIIPRKTIIEILQSNETFLTNYLNISAIYAFRLRSKLHLMSFRTIRQKIAIYLLDLSKETNNNSNVLLDRTQKSLAEYFGVSRPSLSRELAKMQQDNLIQIKNKRIEILNRNELIQLIKFS